MPVDAWSQTIAYRQSSINRTKFIMPKACHSSYNMAFKLKIVAEAEAVDNSEIAREYGLSESMVRRWRKDQAKLFNQQILEWFIEQREQGE